MQILAFILLSTKHKRRSKNGTLKLHGYQPYTAAEILKNLDDDGQISGVVGISLDDIIENDMEGFDDILTERLVGLNCCLSEISYDVVGVEPDENFLHIRVSGYVDDVDYLESQCEK